MNRTGERRKSGIPGSACRRRRAGPRRAPSGTGVEVADGWLTVDADDFKTRLLREAIADGSYDRLLKPLGVQARVGAGEPFFPLELSSLVHEESSLLARNLRHEGPIWLSHSALSTRIDANERVNQAVRQFLTAVAPYSPISELSSTRRLIRRVLPSGGLTIELVAEHLSLRPRTLQRRLTAHGTTFTALVDEVRRDEASRALRDTDITLTQLARELGYIEVSALARSCQRWFGSFALGHRAELRKS